MYSAGTMSWTARAFSLFALATIAASSPPTKDRYSSQPPRTAPVEQDSSQERDSYLPFQTQLPLSLQLPREQNPGPFIAPQDHLYVPEPASDLRAPAENQPNYYQVPVPAQDLVAPSEVEWNPEDDPKLYYEVPAVLTRQEVPTKQFPKKYNGDVHSKKKPYSSRPKQELILEPINEKQFEHKQNQLQKTYDRLAKKENQKIVKNSQVDHQSDSKYVTSNYKHVQSPSSPSSPQQSGRPPYYHHRRTPPQQRPLSSQQSSDQRGRPQYNQIRPQYNQNLPSPDPESSGTADHDEVPPPPPEQYQDDEPTDGTRQGDSSTAETYNQGLSSELTNSLGIPAGNERVLFHLVGHMGPNSYKFGYDTGKGLNRHFRFEERDNLGLVKGHYGFYDKDGKLRVVRYDADPVTGFHAEGNFDNNNEEKN